MPPAKLKPQEAPEQTPCIAHQIKCKKGKGAIFYFDPNLSRLMKYNEIKNK